MKNAEQNERLRQYWCSVSSCSWMGGWMEVKAFLRIAYSNQKLSDWVGQHRVISSIAIFGALILNLCIDKSFRVTWNRNFRKEMEQAWANVCIYTFVAFKSLYLCMYRKPNFFKQTFIKGQYWNFLEHTLVFHAYMQAFINTFPKVFNL